jgi:hypothetical protein
MIVQPDSNTSPGASQFEFNGQENEVVPNRTPNTPKNFNMQKTFPPLILLPLSNEHNHVTQDTFRNNLDIFCDLPPSTAIEASQSRFKL